MVQAPPSATSGVAELDRALGGLYWGDNVVWMAEHAEAVAPFYAALGATATDYHYAAYVAVADDLDEVATRFPRLPVLDARPGTPLDRPEALIAEIRRLTDPFSRDLLLFDSLGAMSSRWGEDAALRFFTRTCPMLLELGAVAYWVISRGAHSKATLREIEEVTQCVVALGDGRLRIVKAEGRPAGVEGSVFRYRVADGRPELTVAPAAARLGAALRSVRLTRGLSQSDVARLAGVSPSAVSQAERGSAAFRSRRCSSFPPSSTSRSTSSCAATSRPATGSAGDTIRTAAPRDGCSRSSTIPLPACAPTSSGFPQPV